mmetsp:Transcript_3770/g.11988  ORF Transcript_3770/g.11988 Transcript_3770/m.11988 type:complete len:252 (-) Transcript_3770:500-1255(-)
MTIRMESTGPARSQSSLRLSWLAPGPTLPTKTVVDLEAPAAPGAAGGSGVSATASSQLMAAAAASSAPAALSRWPRRSASSGLRKLSRTRPPPSNRTSCGSPWGRKKVSASPRVQVAGAPLTSTARGLLASTTAEMRSWAAASSASRPSIRDSSWLAVATPAKWARPEAVVSLGFLLVQRRRFFTPVLLMRSCKCTPSLPRMCATRGSGYACAPPPCCPCRPPRMARSDSDQTPVPASTQASAAACVLKRT